MQVMKRRFFLFMLCFLLLFSGCTKAEKVDIMEFCKQMQALEEDVKISSMQFFKTKERDGMYLHSEILLEENLPLFCSIKINEKEAILACQWTVLNPENAPLSKETQAKIFSIFCTSASILQKISIKESQDALLAMGFSADILHFSIQNIQKEKGKWRFSFLSRKEGLSLFCERI